MPASKVASQSSIPRLSPTMSKSRPQLRTFTSSKHGIRSKFFQSIGILQRPIVNKAPNVSVAERNVRDLRNVPRSNEPLQYSYNHHQYGNKEEEEARVEPSSRQGSEQKMRRVSFEESVTVVSIPMRNEYSDRIRTKLWSGNVEMCKTVERNLAEFAAEDYNWRGACQEEEMYICGDTKERIHPVHIELGHYTFGTGGGICCQRSYYYGM